MTQHRKKGIIILLIIGIVLMTVGSGGFMYHTGYEKGVRDIVVRGALIVNADNKSYFTLPSVCGQIDEFCGVKGIQEYARNCIEEREIISKVVYQYEDCGATHCWIRNGTNYTISYVNETVKELWDSCTGRRIG